MRIYRGKLDLYHYAENEAITVIVPTSFHTGESVYFSWQWTKIPAGCSDTHFFNIGVIAVESTDAMIKAKISFSHDDYHFDALLGHDFKSLILILKLKDGKVQDPTGLHLVYDHQTINDKSALRLFTGKINCNDSALRVSAVDEMFFLVAPENIADRQPLCAFWQWSEAEYDGNTKANVDCVDRIRSVAATPKISFMHGDNHVFEGVVSGDGTKLTATMKSATGEELSHLVLQELRPIAMLANGLSGVTTTFTNDTQEVIYCTLKEVAGSALVDNIIAGVGLALAVLGLPFASTGAKVTAITAKAGIKLFGKWVAGGGVVIGGAGVMSAATAPDGSVSATLYPGESLSRTSSFETTGSRNAVQIIRAYIRKTGKGINSIIVESIDAAGLGDETFSLTKAFPGGDHRARVTVLLQLGMPESPDRQPDRIVSHRLTTFRSLTPNATGQEIDEVPDIVSGDVFATPYGSKMKSYGTLKALLDNAMTAADKKVFLFDRFVADIDPAVTIPGTPDIDTSGYYKLLQLPDGAPVLKLFKCKVSGSIVGPGGDRAITGWNGEDSSAMKLIHDNKKPRDTRGTPPTLPQNRDMDKYYWAYTRQDASTLVAIYGYRKFGASDGNSVEYTGNDDDRVYLVARSGSYSFRKIVTVSN